MKRWIACAAIASYLGALGYGLLAHAVQYRVSSHPAMYFVVWDMFCGWSGYSRRLHLIAQGESGRYYRVTPTPWGEYHPFGDLGREHYDAFGRHAGSIATNCLRQTRHEPIDRVLLIEENWSKKHNVPERFARRLADESLAKRTYCNVWAVYGADGRVLNRNTDWLSARIGDSIRDNPRLHATAAEPTRWVMRAGGPGTTPGLRSTAHRPLGN